MTLKQKIVSIVIVGGLFRLSEFIAKYNYPEDDLQKLVKEDPMWQKPLSTRNPNLEYCQSMI